MKTTQEQIKDLEDRIEKNMHQRQGCLRIMAHLEESEFIMADWESSYEQERNKWVELTEQFKEMSKELHLLKAQEDES